MDAPGFPLVGVGPMPAAAVLFIEMNQAVELDGRVFGDESRCEEAGQPSFGRNKCGDTPAERSA